MKSEAFLGFTVSEVMIAMAIVGVIAAMTIPIVISRYQHQSMLALLKKNYVELQENLQLLYADNFKTSFYRTMLGEDTDNVSEFFSTYYTATQNCGDTAQPCFADSYRSVDSAARTDFSCDNGYSVLLKGGAAMCIEPAEAAVSADDEAGIEAEDAKPAHVYLDVNGSDKPNIGGRDMFSFYIYDYHTIDDLGEDVEEALDESNKRTLRTEQAAGCTGSTTGAGCFARIFADDWKMNY